MDPLDSIPFADDDDDDPVTTTTTTPPSTSATASTTTTTTNITFASHDPALTIDAGDSWFASQEPDPVPSPAGHPGLLENGSEQIVLSGTLEVVREETLFETVESPNQEHVTDMNDKLNEDLNRESADLIQKAPDQENLSEESVDVLSENMKQEPDLIQKTPDQTNTKETSVDFLSENMKQKPDLIQKIPDQTNTMEESVDDLSSDNLNQESTKTDADQIHTSAEQITSNDNSFEEKPAHCKMEPLDVGDTEDSKGESGEVNGCLQQTSDDVIDSQNRDDVIQQTSEREGNGGDGMGMEGVAAVEDEVPLDWKDVEEAAVGGTEAALVDTDTQLEHQENELSVSQGDQTTAREERKLTDTDSNGVDLSGAMDPQGETHGGSNEAGSADYLLDTFFGTTSTSGTVTNGVDDECILRIDESIDGADKDGSTSRPRADKESSPEIIVGSVDSVENVTLKDATSEKALLGSKDEDGSSSQRDSLSSRTDEDKRKSSSDMDFDVLEMDTSYLNIGVSKQKTSLCKKGSLARRKKPTRVTVKQVASDSSDSTFQDTTDSKPLTSPTSDAAEDEVFDKTAKAAESQQSKPYTSGEAYTVRKSAQPFKPSLIMPGLQDLSKSKLFNQERKKSDECSTSPAKSPVSGSSPLSPSHRPGPPTVLPKPTSKIQKDSQNKTIAAENMAQSADSKSADVGSVSSNIVAAAVEEVQLVSKETRTDSVSSSEGPRPGRSDSGSMSGPRFTRTDSWSSVSSPRPMSRRESTSSVEGGEGGGSAHSTPRRASIQGSAYAPIGFRPRRSSSIVLDSNNKLVDVVPTPPSPSSSAPPIVEKDSESSSSSGVRSPTYTPPAWLSEMKAKTGIATDSSSARLRTTSMGSNDGSAVSASSGRSRNSSESMEGVQSQSVADEVLQKKQEEEEAERPGWMKTAEHGGSSAGDDNVASKKDVEENGDKEEKRPVPPWAAELKMKKRPFMTHRISETTGENISKASTLPFKGNNNKENAPVVNSGRDEYSPSWMKTSQQTKKPPPPVPSKPSVAIGSKPSAVKTTTQNPMKQYETPKWKLDLAEKKKRREAEMMSVEESSQETSGDQTSDATDGSGSSSSVPQWRQQLSQRKKNPNNPDVVNDAENGLANADWAKKAEERRARLMKSGLFDKAEAAEES
ncbi:uncharacterized protein LOC143288432 isoform X2 [Babylonia areolata]|uniref:uncharacterized protein LOC143288432 isoform X2 n=1 Tax=Babylonia areolata TaxID=304850 RepID=UPI003FD5BA58